MGQRIRAHMAAIDERCLIGGAGKMVAAKLVKILRITNTRRNVQNSATVLLLSDANRVRATVVSRPSQKCLRAIIGKQVRSRSRLMTDCFWSFRVLSNYSSGRPIAEFVPDYFIDRPPHENLNHGFRQYLNLSFADQYRGVSLEKAWLYLKDYEFRYNRRTRSAETFREMTSSFPLLDEKSLRRIRAASFVEA
jgi:transposase-like protein